MGTPFHRLPQAKSVEALGPVHERVLLAANLYGAAHTSFRAKDLRAFMVGTGGDSCSTMTIAGALLHLANRNHLLKVAQGEFARLPVRPTPATAAMSSTIKPPSLARMMAGRAR
ncbi:MAG TPA: hypothetical protein VHZ78_08735 [Rhizomicrobium sp.]|jgi:hypothetical protein|nr:hypothetical protein [Rhizomicrobium sp.]